MSKKKTFKYGDFVLVNHPWVEPFWGRVYSEYTISPGNRRICVEKPNGCGVGYHPRWVHKVKVAGISSV